MPKPGIKVAKRLIERGKAESAIPILEHLTKRYSFYVTPWILLARAHEAEGRMESSLESWRKAFFLQPSSTAIKEALDRHRDIQFGLGKQPALEPSPTTSTTLVGHSTLSRDPIDHDVVMNGPTPDMSQSQDLDELIAQLKDARITPSPPDFEAVPEDPAANSEDVVSETLARIYLNQGLQNEAATVYKKLADQTPDRAEYFLGKAEEILSSGE